MTISLYLQCFLIATIGALLQAAIYLKNLQSKAQKANVEFKPARYFAEDWLSITISILTILAALMLTGEALNIKPEILSYIKFTFLFIGYFSQDIASRLLGAMNKKVNQIIDEKTTVADSVNGTLAKPTPLNQKKETETKI